MRAYTFFFLAVFLPGNSDAAFCELLSPKKSVTGPDDEFGLIMIPGSLIPGEKYKPLAVKIQDIFPGKLWVGVTEGWLVDMPNPIEISDAIKSCLEAASSQGLSTENVFMSGHSLGGIILETYIRDHPESSSGIILFGSYLADGPVGPDDNVFPVPVLTAVGTLDGGVLSYVLREWRESAKVDETQPDLAGRFPVILVDRVNHAQVAAGVEPEKPSLRFEDIEAEVTESEAHTRYATAAVAFFVAQKKDLFDEATSQMWSDQFLEMKDFTETFLAPFDKLSKLELVKDLDGVEQSPWIATCQKILLGVKDVDQLPLVVKSSVVSFLDLGGVKPALESADCEATIQTYNHNQYPSSLLDSGVLLSADVMKAKFKLEDVVLSGLCQPVGHRSQCKDLNKAAYDLAMSVASDEAVERLLNKGRQLTFVNDEIVTTGLGWVTSGGLKYSQVDESHVELKSVSLLTEPDVVIEELAGMHYCDVLSPFRALEWIYISGVIRI